MNENHAPQKCLLKDNSRNMLRFYELFCFGVINFCVLHGAALFGRQEAQPYGLSFSKYCNWFVC